VGLGVGLTLALDWAFTFAGMDAVAEPFTFALALVAKVGPSESDFLRDPQGTEGEVDLETAAFCCPACGASNPAVENRLITSPPALLLFRIAPFFAFALGLTT